jgi:hypothetical protein
MSDQLSHLRQPFVGNGDTAETHQPRRQRSFRLEVLIGIVLIALGVVGAFWLRQAGSNTVEVVGVVRDLPAGHAISDGDLMSVEVASEVKEQFVPVDLRADMLGSVLISAVSMGPVARAAVQSSAQILGEGESLIATAMEEGTFPPALSVGNVVAIVTTPSTSVLDGDVSRLTQTAVVYAVSPPNQFSTKTVVTLRAESEVAEKIAASGPVHLSILQMGPLQ